VTRDGTVHEGFLAADTTEALVLRLPGAPDRRIARPEVRSAGYLARSLMPAGLLEGLAPEQAADLLAYLQALR
jgi:putative heme-binding domain-containing protein